MIVTLGEKIKRYRKSLRMTQTELGERLGVKTNAVSKWECGRVEDIPTSKIKAMAVLFNAPVSELIDDEATAPLVNGDSDLTSYLELLRTRPEMRALLDTAVGATKEEVEENVRFIEALRHAKKAD